MVDKLRFKNVKVLLICRQGEVLRKYSEILSDFGIQFDIASTYENLYQNLTQKRYNGVMIDIKTKIRDLKPHKESVNSILKKYPFLHLRYDGQARKMFTFFYGQTKGKGSIEDFLEIHCATNQPRKLRTFNIRRDIHFNVYLSKFKDIDVNYCERTVTMNVSTNGCFIFSNGIWKLNENAWFIFKELSGTEPICGLVRWRTAWGTPMRIPGIGLEFTSITKHQTDEILSIL